MEVSGAQQLPAVKDPRRWRQVLHELLRHHNGLHSNGQRGVSRKTMKERKLILFAFFRDLRRQGVRIDPRSLGRRHIELMVRLWRQRGLSAGTIQNNLSVLRTFAAWIGKRGLVASTEAYAEDALEREALKRASTAQIDRSWTATGADVDELLARVDAIDQYVGAQLRLCRAFGLRLKEALRLDPWRCVVRGEEIEAPSAHPWFLAILKGAKGGRRRYVPIETQQQWDALAHARAVVGQNAGHMGRPGMRLEQNYRRFYYVLDRCGITRRQLGVTAHGLRHEYAHEVYEGVAGVPPPVVQAVPVAWEADHEGRLQVSERLGHSRKHIAGAYLGAVLARRYHDRRADVANSEGDRPADGRAG